MFLTTKSSELSGQDTKDNIQCLKQESKRQAELEKEDILHRAKERRLKISSYMKNLKALTNKENKSLFRDMV